MRSDFEHAAVDRMLAKAFASGADQTDDGFTAAVVGRIRRRRVLRRVLLGAAGLVGAALALEPAWTLMADIATDTAALVDTLPVAGGPTANPVALSAAGLALLALLITRALDA